MYAMALSVTSLGLCASKVSAQRDRLEARNAQLEAEERGQLREALGAVHRDMQAELGAGAAYLACVQDLADSQVCPDGNMAPTLPES